MTKIISVRVLPEYDRRIRLAAARLDLNRSDFIRVALDAKLAQMAATEESPEKELTYAKTHD
jgi:hypothetical protein